jgi:hypothetical protein
MSKPIVDLYLVAYLQVKGFKLLKSEKKDRKTLFYFEKDDLSDEINKYFNHQTSVDPLLLSETLRSLKSFVKMDS